MKLGFGLMRLPRLENGSIDIEQAINSKMQKNAQRAALEGDKL